MIAAQLKKLILVQILFVGTSQFAQSKVVFKDETTGKPIPYVGIYTNSKIINFSANKKGKIDVPDFNENDSLYFFARGYEEKKIIAGELKAIQFLKATENNNRNDFSIGKDTLQILDYREPVRKFRAISSAMTNLNAYFVDCSNLNEDNYILKNVSLATVSFLKNESFFRLRFFESDENQKIGKEIFTSEDIICKASGIPKDRSFEVIKNSTSIAELIKYKIPVTKKGIFIAIESLNLKGNIFKGKGKEYLSIMPMFQQDNFKDKSYLYVKGKWVHLKDGVTSPKMKISVITTEK